MDYNSKPRLIAEGDYVVMVRTYDVGNNKIVCVEPDALVYFGKLQFVTNNLIGCDYGSVFEISDKQLVRIENFDDYNSSLSDTVSSSLATFNQKSQFSQEKIIKKKKKQNHANILTVIEPKLDLLHEMLYARGKIGGLRIDLLAQVLSLANVQNGTRCLLLDHNLGILTAAIMSRSLPDGCCVQVMPNIESVHTTRKSMEMLNIDVKDRIYAITMKDAYKVLKNVEDFKEEERLMKAKDEQIKCKKESQNSSFELNPTLLERDQKRQNKSSERQRAVALLKSRSIDALVIYVQNDHPLGPLKMLLDFLAPSKQIVIYSDKIGPLLECHHYMKSNALAISLSLTETWFRKYQVLPDRTRPEMNTAGHGGYLLSGTKIYDAGLGAAESKFLSGVITGAASIGSNPMSTC